MAAGIEIYNNKNVIQVTDNLRNLTLIEKGTISSGNILTCKDTELIALRCENGKYVGVGVMPSVYIAGGITYTKVVGTGTITYYKFGDRDVNPGNYFEVRNENGKIMFSDNDKYMKVIGSNTGISRTSPPFAGPIDSVVIPQNRIAAVVIGKSCLTLGFSDGANYYMRSIYAQYFNFSENAITSTYEMDYNSGYPANTYVVSSSYSYLVVDVTGL